MGIIREQGGPQGHIVGGHAVGDSADDTEVTVVKGPKTVVVEKGVVAYSRL